MRKTSKILFLCLIVLNFISSIQCLSQEVIVKTDTAKYCFTSTEMNYFIGAAYDSHTYLNLIDSIKLINHRNELKLSGKDYELKEGKALMVVKDTLISYQKQESDYLKSELKTERKQKALWKTSTGIIGGAAILIIGYQAIKQ